MEHVLIVGGGVAAHQAVKSIIETRPDTRVSVISAEPHLPYDRPHLSKAYLTADRLEPPLLPGAQRYSEATLTLYSGARAAQIDRAAARLQLDDGRQLGYDKLIIATGSRVRQLPTILARAPLHYLRTFDDARALREQLFDGAEVVIIGGGFIGLEVAAAARQRHCRVTVIEPQPCLLARTGCQALSDWTLALHRANGVQVQLGVSVSAIDPGTAGKTVVATSAGPLLADLVIVGIGVQPNVELAADCGLAVDDGIVVDATCATSEPNIFAAGEVTRYPIAHLGVHTRSESWTVAGDQGAVAGRAASGDASARYTDMPWLWSDQYTSSIQCIGLPSLACKYSLLGEPTSNAWLALGWSADNRLACAIAANRNRDISAIKRALKRNDALPDVYASTLASATVNAC